MSHLASFFLPLTAIIMTNAVLRANMQSSEPIENNVTRKDKSS